MRSYFSKKLLLIGFVTTLALGILVGGFTPTVRAECVEDASKSQYCLLEPIPIGNGQTYDKYDPAVSSTADFINFAIKIFISIIGALGVIMIVLGGIQYMTTDAISKKEGGKEMISNSIFGVVLALFSWVLLNTVNPNLLDIRIDPPKGVSVTVSATDELPAATKTITTTINGQNVSVTTNCSQESVNAVAADGVALNTGAAWGSVPVINNNDADYRKKLAEIGVNVNKGNCATVGQSGCTTVYRLGTKAIDGLTKLRNNVCKENSSCSLTLTGGTECWLHQSHQIGSGKVDLASLPLLDSYIKAIATKKCVDWIAGESGDGCPTGQAGQYILGSSVFIRESDHWHVSQW